MSRLTHRILCASMAACLGLGSLAAYAQPGPPREGRGSERADDRGHYDNQHQDRNRYDNRHDGRHMGRDEHRGAGPDHRWTRGTRVPPQYRGHNYVVNDWRAHRLPAPPRGHHWIQNGSDYLLVAIATGVIASMVLNSSY